MYADILRVIFQIETVRVSVSRSLATVYYTRCTEKDGDSFLSS